MSTSDSSSDSENSEVQIIEIKKNMEEECLGDFPLSILEKISKKEAILAATNKEIEKLNFLKSYLEHEQSKLAKTLDELNEYNIVVKEEQDKRKAQFEDAKWKMNFFVDEIKKLVTQKKTIEMKSECFSQCVEKVRNHYQNFNRTLSNSKCNYLKEEESLNREINEIERELKMEKESPEVLERLCKAGERRVAALEAENQHLKAQLEDKCYPIVKKPKHSVQNHIHDKAHNKSLIIQHPTIKKKDEVVILRKKKEHGIRKRKDSTVSSRSTTKHTNISKK